ncbi:putative oxidative stress response protein Oxr1 [Aspergillus clavatus NRRL 1]|uniref:Oxidation resistance protein 1 n=1 Tax=Aspergillus clavatus (strain ATCC 1007 / CBS 513.65 / DSM 816 / NCTC 3887 / NRRL 1 / QM 1276 / 107) TaxID=344612 RepID=A1CJZ3_ASPCL|nr:TLD domain containing protein [Aspergillus clavatus NRRL 1]EAW09467.1 TLD domain containing protein [Aspergillus clavatus NRRL 1]
MSSISQEDPPSSIPTPSLSLSSSSSSPGSRTPQTSTPLNQSAVSYFSYPVTHVVSGLYRRLTDPNITKASRKDKDNETTTMNSSSKSFSSKNNGSSASSSGVFTPMRTASPFQPPPLTPLTLTLGTTAPDSLQQQLLARALAEEIRLLVPPRLQLVDTWRLAYSLDRDGASLATLYENCYEFSLRSPRAGFVLIIRDSSPSGAVFGAYMTDPPRPNPHYFGTGECFLWRASVLRPPALLHASGPQPDQMLDLAGLPPPPSADTTHAGRSTTLRSDPKTRPENMLVTPRVHDVTPSGASTPERIRFKAFPYSGVNDYMMFCETGFLSLGGGDGHFGLWVDSSLEKGVSAPCLTFGNEPLSDEGIKFDILGVEVWYIGS